MKPKHRICVILVCICLAAVCLAAVFANGDLSIHTILDPDTNLFRQLGEYFQDAKGANSGTNAANSGPVPLAEYQGEIVYQSDVEYHKKFNGVTVAATGQDLPTSDEEVLRKILENIVLLHEAERLGLAATQAEIDEMVENARYAYTLPDGKEVLDQFCAGAGITIDEYFAYLEEQAPRSIARQKLLNAVGEEFCEQNGLTFTKVNPPKELVEAKEDYVDDLFEQAQDEIIYYTD